MLFTILHRVRYYQVVEKFLVLQTLRVRALHTVGDKRCERVKKKDHRLMMK